MLPFNIVDRRKFPRRGFFIELGISAAIAAAPYLVALVGKLGPARVPVWAVALVFVGCLIVFQAVDVLGKRRNTARKQSEDEASEKKEIIVRLDRVERKLNEMPPRRSWTLRR